MIKWILAAVEIIKALMELYKHYRRFKENQRIVKEKNKGDLLERSISEAEKAKTPDEAFDAQKGIVDNSN